MLDERCDIWLESHLAGPRTLVHGDFRPDNFAFERNGEIVVFDWQTARFDPGSRDVAYFLAFALPADLRRAHESALLALYYQTLLSHGVQDYSFEQVLTNHRRSVGSAAMRLVMAGAFVEFSNERARQLVAALFERVGAALEDHSFTSWEPTV
jgi:aminoglycoside phosphotransferase (APT) family kinase protein